MINFPRNLASLKTLVLLTALFTSFSAYADITGNTGGILINLSTRGFVGTGDSVMIAGFCVTDAPIAVAVRALGPSLAEKGVANVLRNPAFDIYKGSTIIYSNDDWQNDQSSSVLRQLKLAPADSKEAATLVTLNPGCYTVIVKSADGTTGVALVELFDIAAQ